MNNIIAKWKINRSMPRFIITNTDIAKDISKEFKIEKYDIGHKIDDIRNLIVKANNIKTPIIFNIVDGEKMLISAQNSLLKLAEEPPNKCYIILNTNDMSKILPTLKSRAIIIENIEACSIHIDLVDKVIEDLNNLSGVSLLNHCNELRNKDTEVDKVDCTMFYGQLLQNLHKIKRLNFIRSSFDISYCSKCMQNNTNKKMAIETLLLKILEECKKNED